MSNSLQKATIGAGCFWCVDDVPAQFSNQPRLHLCIVVGESYREVTSPKLFAFAKAIHL